MKSEMTIGQAMWHIRNETPGGYRTQAVETIVKFFKLYDGYCVHNGDMYTLQDKHTKVEDKDGNIAFVGFKKYEIKE